MMSALCHHGPCLSKSVTEGIDFVDIYNVIFLCKCLVQAHEIILFVKPVMIIKFNRWVD